MNRALKRAFDIILAVLGLIIAAPIMAVIALLVYVESPGRVIFSQARLGRGGRVFRMHKFRKFPACWTDAGPGVTVSCDPRMTRMGMLLERLKFDELPQLWNILQGEMSFVGPRPESKRFADLFTGKYAAVLEYVPGIFGPNQIAFRNESTLYPADQDPEVFYRRVLFPQKAEADLAYFRNSNLFNDIGWIVRGVWESIAGVINWRHFLGLHWKIVTADIVAIMFAWTIAGILRYSGLPGGTTHHAFLFGLWFLPVVLLLGMFAGSCYQHQVRCFSLADVLRLMAVVTPVLLLAFIVLIQQDRSISLYLAPITWFVLMPLLAAPRVFSRVRWENKHRPELLELQNIMIYGAGRGGTALGNWVGNGKLVGFVDDDPTLRGRRLYGYPVLGRESDIPNIHEVHRFGELWVTFRPDLHKRKRLEELCRQRDIRLVIIPDMEPFVRLAPPLKDTTETIETKREQGTELGKATASNF